MPAIYYHAMAVQPQHNMMTEQVVKIEHNVPISRLEELRIKSWPKWRGRPGKYTMKFEATETCYLLRGKVKAHYTNEAGTAECVEFAEGDLAVFPRGLYCTWEVVVTVDKHYSFEHS